MIVGPAVTVILVVAAVGVAATVGVWLTWRSPAALSDENTPWRPRIVDGTGRPAGPDAEAMGARPGGDRDGSATAGRGADGCPTTATGPTVVVAQIGPSALAARAAPQATRALSGTGRPHVTGDERASHLA